MSADDEDDRLGRAGVIRASSDALEFMRGTMLRGPKFAAKKALVASWTARGYLQFRKAERAGLVMSTGRVSFMLERGRAVLGKSVMFIGGMIATVVRVRNGGTLNVGDETVFGFGSRYEADGETLTIGKRCIFAPSVTVVTVVGEKKGPITLGDDIWVAHGATIMPGVTIGDGAVIAAGSVVTKDVPARHMAVGNPARAMPQAMAKDR